MRTGRKESERMLQGNAQQDAGGRRFIVEPKSRSKCAGTLTIRYYVDNLSPERRTYAEAMEDQK